MLNPAHLAIRDGRLCFSLLPVKSFTSPFRFIPSLSSLSLNQRSRKLILREECRVRKPIVCRLGRSRHSFRIRHRKLATLHGKPASLGHRKAKRKIKMRVAEEEKKLPKIHSAQPSENCLSRLSEEQPLRLHNNSPTFQCISQDLDILTPKTPMSFREDYFGNKNGSSQVRDSDGVANLKPDFSTRLLDILSGAKKEFELNDIKSTGQFFEEKLEEVTMQRHPQSDSFTSSQIPSRLVKGLEKWVKLSGGTSNESMMKHIETANELKSDVQADLFDEESLDSPLVKRDIPQGEHSTLEESDFSSESSDDDVQNKEESVHGIHRLGSLSSEYSERFSESNKMVQSESFPSTSYCKGKSFISPRHLSKSSGSRSNPSRPSIPGLRSKYSKPDPKAKPSKKWGTPLFLLPKFEVTTEGINKSSPKGNKSASIKLPDAPEERGLENDIDLDWWESDQDDDKDNDLPMSVKPVNACEFSRPLKLQPNSDVDTKIFNGSQLTTMGTLRCFEHSSKQTGNKPQEWIDFEWSDSDEEKNLRTEDKNLLEWSEMDANMVLKNEKYTFGARDVDARSRNCRENGTLFSDAPHSISSKRRQEGGGHKNVSLRPLTWYNREVCENFTPVNYVDHRLFLEENQSSVQNNETHLLPASVKFLEVPPWKSQIYPQFPFQFEYSYSEIPKAPVLGYRDHFSPFGAGTMERPWTGRPLIKPRRHMDAIKSFDPVLEKIKSFELSFNRKWQPPKRVKSREEVLGEPLTDDEVILLVRNCHAEKSQVNLGRDGLTHNMLHLIHNHWKRRPVCRIKCRGVPTLDMDNVCFHIEDKTGGQIIYRTGCVLYVFRGRHYSYKYRPVLPYMLYRPSSPVYPKLVPQAPPGLTSEEAQQLRILGQKVNPLMKLRKNGAYPDLVRLVRDAFMVDNLVTLDYEGLKAGDYRKIGAKLRELVPCVLLSLRNNRLVLWRGRASSPFSPYSSALNVETPQLANTLNTELVDVDSSSVVASKSRSSDNSIECLSGKAADVRIQIAEEKSSLYQESQEESIELHQLDNTDPRCDVGLIGSLLSEQHLQTGLLPCRDVELQSNVLEASSMAGELNAVWDMALKDGVAVELEGVDLEADLVLQLASVFSEVVPHGPKYTNRLVNRLRLLGENERLPKQFIIPFRVKRERLPKRKRLRMQTPHPPKIKRHVDIPLDAVARILVD